MAASSLARVGGDFIAFVQLLRTAQEGAYPQPEALRHQLLSLLEPLSKSADTEHIPSEEIEEARFALVAWADETVLRSAWPGRDHWQREPLQKELYRMNRAGNEFFEHLARLRPEQSAAREVYLLVLGLGFEGQYAGQEAERRALIAHQYEMLRAAGHTLELGTEPRLTPPAYELEIDLPRGGGRSVLVWLALIAVGSGVVYGALWIGLKLVAPEVPIPQGL